MKGLWLGLALLALAACKAPAPRETPMSAPLTWTELQARPLPPPVARQAYGSAPQQFGELRVPAGTGPFPVVVLIHGGCWRNAFDLAYITRLAAAITELGYATWTIEYRRLGDAGGGWPGTFLDVADATDHLRSLARTAPLDLQRLVTMGHSAGGQLALWLAARPRLPADSPLHRTSALPVKAVVGLAPITDLAHYRIGPPDSCHASVDPLLGGSPEQQPQRYAQTSPRALLPLGVPQILVQGAQDPIVPAAGVADYADAARAAGDTVQLLRIEGAGHFDPAAPDTATWPALREALQAALGRGGA